MPDGPNLLPRPAVREEYLKALLVIGNIDFPKTHDLTALMSLVPPKMRPTLEAPMRTRLTRYATVARYPGSGDITLLDAKRALAAARRVRKDARRKLPKEVLRRQAQTTTRKVT